MDNKIIEFSDNDSTEYILTTIKDIFDLEAQSLDVSAEIYDIRLKNISQEAKVSVLEYCLNNDKIINSNIIINISNLIKGYNTFDDSFFAHSSIMFNDLEEFLDIKIELNRELANFNKKVIFYYLSIIKSIGITETNDVKASDIPLTIQRILQTLDFLFLANIMQKIKNIQTDELILIKDAYQYMAMLSNNFNIANFFLEEEYNARNGQ